MYMTVLKMNRFSILSATNLLDINSSNSVHKWLTEQQDTHRVDGKLLYRVINKNDEIYIYIQSKDKFNISNISEYGFVFVKEISINISQQGVYCFDIQTFPNKTTENNKRYFIKDINSRYFWLQKKLKAFDIDLIECIEYNTSNIVFDKYEKTKSIPTASYRGKIIINDIQKANNLIENGFGRFKNYGLGLFLVK